MAGEASKVLGSWVSAGTGIVLSADTWTEVSASDFVALLGAVESLYPEFEMKVDVTTGTPAENDLIEVNLRMSDGTTAEPAPSGNFAPHFVGSVILDNASLVPYYKDGLAILSEKATIYIKCATALTVSVSIRAKTIGPAA